MADLEPKTRSEVYLNAISEGGGEVPEPITRKELFYSAILGNVDVADLPEPLTREEVYLKGIAENGGGGGGGSYEFGQLDTTDFTKVYNDEKFGTNGKLASVLDYKSYNTCYSNMLAGWDGNKGATYDVENSIGAYAGYTFDKRYIEEIRLFLGKYTGQTQTLYADIEYLDDSSVWVKLDTVEVSYVGTSYPVNCVILPIRKEVCGIRWIHQTQPNKTSGNTITFFGLCLYGKQDTSKLPYAINLSSLVSSDGTFTA